MMEAAVPRCSPLGHPPGVGDEHLLTGFPWAGVHLALASLLGLSPCPQPARVPCRCAGTALTSLQPRRERGAFAIKRLPSPFLLLKPNGTM